ncbi:MAG: MGMT family protein [Anaerolineae bacterium]
MNFFEKVYRLVSMIPRGKVASYGQIARMLGSPHGARTVGWAVHGLTDGPVDDLFVAFGDCDDPSLIENCLFWEGNVMLNKMLGK